MRRRASGVLIGLVAAGLAIGTTSIPAGASSSIDSSAEPGAAPTTQRGDSLPSPLTDKAYALRMTAMHQVLDGTAKMTQKAGSSVIEVSPGQYVEWQKQREETIFTMLVEFGKKTDDRADGKWPGPVHNKIEKPDRKWDGGETDDNSTNWAPDFNVSHYEHMFFGDGESFRDFYLHQSQGKFLANGEVSNWVKVPYNEARYGSNHIAQNDGYWNFIKDSAKSWYAAQIAKGMTPAEIKEYLARFDVWDRYDYNGNGNFNEPDGYIDHFQDIHAGEGEEAGGGKQGDDAIWSHRWYAYSDLIGQAGPNGNLNGGVQIGRSGIWIGDYTTEAENGGVGLFSHEFGHDLGLPDLYDTSAGGDNGTGFWTLMSAGSWLNHGGDALGTTPGYMDPWSKLFLGWLDYKVVLFKHGAQVKLGPAAGGSRLAQAAVVTLPDKVTSTDYNTPFSGVAEWWGGSADNLNSTLTRQVDLSKAKKSAELSTKAWYVMEEGYDYLYGEVSTNGGTSWASVGDAIDGDSAGWTDITYDLSKYVGKKVLFRYRYHTDGGVHYAGPFLDDVSLTADGKKVWTDDVEEGDGDWTGRGFTIIDGSVTIHSLNYYLAENRAYIDYDETLETGPYQFGWLDTRPNWVERFPYQNGLLIWYADESQPNNNTGAHPGQGLVLPVDARPAPIVFKDGTLLGNRRQPFDATFGWERTDAVTFHRYGEPVHVPSHKAMRVFDDTHPRRYWSKLNFRNSVWVAGTGTRIEVVKSGVLGDEMTVRVTFN